MNAADEAFEHAKEQPEDQGEHGDAPGGLPPAEIPFRYTGMQRLRHEPTHVPGNGQRPERDDAGRDRQ